MAQWVCPVETPRLWIAKAHEREVILMSGKDTILVAIPFIALLIMGLFRLDGMFIKSRKKSRRPPPPSGVDEEGRPIFSDPDGRQNPYK